MKTFILTPKADNKLPTQIKADRLKVDSNVAIFIANDRDVVAVVNVDSVLSIIQSND